MNIKTIIYRGKQLDVKRSTRKDKKFMVEHKGKKIHFGAKGYKISPGTDKGDRYCSRSLGIKSGKGLTPNKLSRKMWKCKGKRSRK